MTLHRSSASRTATPGQARSSIPPELVFDILDKLPAKSLLACRAVSREFRGTSDSLLRGRLLKAVRDPSQELAFVSHPPADYHKHPAQTLDFLGFEYPGLSGCLARFAVPTYAPQYLPLDDDQQFGSWLLSIHLRGVEPPSGPGSESDSSSPSSTPSTSFTASSSPLSTRSSSPLEPRNFPFTPSVFPTSSTALQRSFLTFSLSLAEGLDRVFRTWFEVSSSPEDEHPSSILPRPIPTPPSHDRASWESLSRSSSHRREVVRHVLEPSGRSLGPLKDAEIDCVRVAAPSGDLHGNWFENEAERRGRGVETTSRLYEFTFSQVRLDVGKLMVGIEEGLHSCRRDTVMYV